MYGTVRRVLDIWESYFGQRIVWHFMPPAAETGARALRGLGECPLGVRVPRDWATRSTSRVGENSICLNFDVLAHELGHLIIYGVVGTPAPGTETAEYFGFHESAGDLTALIAVLRFDLVADHVLRQTAGNLYNLSELSRIGEISQTTQIRIADNDLKMSDVADAATPAEILCQPARHSLAQPLTGAVFDLLVDIYQRTLFERGLISASLDRASGRVSGDNGRRSSDWRDVCRRLPRSARGVQAGTAGHGRLPGHPAGVGLASLVARLSEL